MKQRKSSGTKTIIANGKMDQYKRIKSTGNGDYVGKYMRYISYYLNFL